MANNTQDMVDTMASLNKKMNTLPLMQKNIEQMNQTMQQLNYQMYLMNGNMHSIKKPFGVMDNFMPD